MRDLAVVHTATPLCGLDDLSDNRVSRSPPVPATPSSLSFPYHSSLSLFPLLPSAPTLPLPSCSVLALDNELGGWWWSENGRGMVDEGMSEWVECVREGSDDTEGRNVTSRQVKGVAEEEKKSEGTRDQLITRQVLSRHRWSIFKGSCFTSRNCTTTDWLLHTMPPNANPN